MSILLVYCSGCCTLLQLPPDATAFRCAVCDGIGHIAAPRKAPLRTTSSYYNNYNHIPVVYCSGCCTLLQLPPGATAFRCAACHGIGHIAAPCKAPLLYLPTTSSYYNNYNHGQKKAVIIGILYRNSEKKLKGCINDAKSMKDMLIHRFNFAESSILMLTEEESDPCKIPTKHNILTAMSWLVDGCKLGDSLVFYFSGHGGWQWNNTGDEKDNRDETLLPLDHKTRGIIVDDEINARIVRPLPSGVKLHAIIDACHSGTMLDLPYLCKMDRSGRHSWDDHNPKSGAWKGTSGGEVISISGCADNQHSKDTNVVTNSTCFLSEWTNFSLVQLTQVINN